PGRHLDWDYDATTAFDRFINTKTAQIKMFVQPTMEAAAEREAKIRNNRSRNISEHKAQSARVSLEDVTSVISTHTAGIEWSDDALTRVESAPEFVRGGIKKAAEFSARREGLSIIETDDLTRFRNRAMMRAVNRMKGFGMTDLSFGAYNIAKDEIPRLKENEQASKRFETIRDYVESRKGENGEGLGLMDQELLDKMKAELRDNAPENDKTNG
ncbi:MAG: PCP reductase family protein, partial [Chromatiales bacterium]|nr:PCP reductase family protein [Chromatiales bacterium]